MSIAIEDTKAGEEAVTANCCHCGRIVDTREVGEGGDDFGSELIDGRWTCSAACWGSVVCSGESFQDETIVSEFRALAELTDPCVSPVQLTRAADAIERLQAENFALSADICHAGYAGEHGHHRCREIDAAIARAETAEAELALIKAGPIVYGRVPPLHERIVPAQGDEVACPAAADVLAERRRQIKTEGWSPEHDDQHQRQELSLAAACYALGTTTPYGKTLWPWHYSAWKPRNYRTNLIKAGALILAEIERLDRAANKGDA